MSDFMKIDLVGEKELQNMLKKIGGAPTKRVLKKAIRKVGNNILADLRTSTPKDRGRLRKSWKLRVLKFKKKYMVGLGFKLPTRAELGIPGDAKGYYPTALEYGYTDKSGTTHPPLSFIRGSTDRNQQSGKGIISGALRKEIPKEAKKLAKKRGGK